MDRRKVVILMADDDEEDCLLFQEALEESSLAHELHCFGNGKELMDYVQPCAAGKGEARSCPDLIILDLNMPVKNGRATLQEIKEHPELKEIPVMVLTESLEEADRALCYSLGVESFLTKAEWFQVLVEVIRTSGEYWFDFMCRGRRGKAMPG